MKKTTLAFATAFGALVAGSAFAHSADVLINFTPLGDTYYATGEKVGAGEWWALGWSADGVFEGIKADLTTIDPADKLLLKGKVSTPDILFQVPYQDAPATGQYHILVLDTRNAAGEPSPAGSAPAIVNGSHIANGALAASAVGGVTTTAEAVAVSGSYAIDESKIVKPAEITGFVPNGDTVTITVENMVPAIAYKVTYGDSLENLKSAEYTILRSNYATKVQFTIDAKDARFFKLDK